MDLENERIPFDHECAALEKSIMIDLFNEVYKELNNEIIKRITDTYTLQ